MNQDPVPALPNKKQTAKHYLSSFWTAQMIPATLKLQICWSQTKHINRPFKWRERERVCVCVQLKYKDIFTQLQHMLTVKYYVTIPYSSIACQSLCMNS